MAKQKRYANTAARRKTISGLGAANRVGTRVPLVPTLGAHSTNSITLTFPDPVVLAGIPNYSNGSITVNAAVRGTPNTVTLTGSGNWISSIPLTIPFEDTAIRNSQGGYVQPGTYTFS